MMHDLIINFTPTGMVPTKAMNPSVPIEVNEIIEEVHHANDEGITLVHLHARDENGDPTYKREVYEKIIDGIRTHCPDLVICVSLSGRNYNEFEKRSEPIALMPDMGSLTLSSLNFPNQSSVNAPDMIVRLMEKMNEYGVNPELEIFDLGMIHFGKYLIKKGLIQPPFYFNIIFGNIAGMQSQFHAMGSALHELPEQSYWAFGGIGGQQLQSNVSAIAMGGGVRVGLEDNLYFDKNKISLATNISLIRRIKEVAEIFERKIMTSSDFGNLGFYNRKRSRS
jgi:3-keto-5-aminohexanoate cleavage enzyme